MENSMEKEEQQAATINATAVEVLRSFNASQVTAACHQKNSFVLRKIYRQTDLDAFWNALVKVINVVLIQGVRHKNRYVERAVDFLAEFCATIANNKQNQASRQDEDFSEDPLIVKIFRYLLQCSKHPSDTVRYRSCHLINKITEHLTDFQFSDDLCNEMQEILIERLSDVKGAVRYQAVDALYRFQNPNDPENNYLIDEFIQLFRDSQAQVRYICVEKIAFTRKVSNYIIKQTRDVNPKVRLAAYKRLPKLIKMIKIADRRSLITSAMLESAERVKDYVYDELLASWWEVYNCNILDLLRSFRLDADEKDIKATNEIYEHILNRFYFKHKTDELLDPLKLTNEKLVPFEELNYETVIYWRVLVSHFVKKSCENEIDVDAFVPQVGLFCRYIREYIGSSHPDTAANYLQQQYIIKQLFLILKQLDFLDSHSMKSVRTLIEFILKNEELMDDVIEIIVGCVEQVCRVPESQCQFAMELISDIMCPVDPVEELSAQKEREFQLARLKVQMADLQQQQDIAIEAKNYMEAERLKHLLEQIFFQINDLKNAIIAPVQREAEKRTDIPTISKCLDIAWATLRVTNISELVPTLKAFKDDYLVDLLVHDNEIVRLKALRCFAICCIYDKPAARQGIHIFAIPILDYQAGEECSTQLLLMSIAAVSDLLLLYGNDLLAVPQDDQKNESGNEEHQEVFAGGTTLSALVQGLADLMDDEQYEIQLQACEGLCKLVLGERIQSPNIISRLILKWCNPSDEEDSDGDCLKQFIGRVLEKVPYLSAGANQLEGAVLLTIDALVSAPRESPLATVDIPNMVKFILALCRASPKGRTIHCNLAFSLCRKMHQDPGSKINTLYSKMLLMLDLPEEQDVLEELFVIIDDAREYINDKVALKNVTKFLSILTEFIGGEKDASVIEAVEEASSSTAEEEEDSENSNDNTQVS